LDEHEVGVPRHLVEWNRRLLHQLLELGEHLVGDLEVRCQLTNLSGPPDASIALPRELLRVIVEQIARRNRAPEPRRVEPTRRSVEPAIRLDAAAAVDLAPRIRVLQIFRLVDLVAVL